MFKILIFFSVALISFGAKTQPRELTNRITYSERFRVGFKENEKPSNHEKIFSFPGFAVLFRPPAIDIPSEGVPQSEVRVSPRATFHLKKGGPVYAEIDKNGLFILSNKPTCRLCFNSECENKVLAYNFFYADIKSKFPIHANDRYGTQEKGHCPDFYRLNPTELSFGDGFEAILTREKSDRDFQDVDGRYFRYTSLLHDFDGDYGLIKGAGENGEDLYVKFHPDDYPYLYIMPPHSRFHELMQRYHPDFKERFKILAEQIESNKQIKNYFDTLTNKERKEYDIPPEKRKEHAATLAAAGPALHDFLKGFMKGKVADEYVLKHFAIANYGRFEIWMRHEGTKTFSIFEIELPEVGKKIDDPMELFLFHRIEIELEYHQPEELNFPPETLYYINQPIVRERRYIGDERASGYHLFGRHEYHP